MLGSHAQFTSKTYFLKAIIGCALAEMIMELLEVRPPGHNLECYLGSGHRLVLHHFKTL